MITEVACVKIPRQETVQCLEKESCVVARYRTLGSLVSGWEDRLDTGRHRKAQTVGWEDRLVYALVNFYGTCELLSPLSRKSFQQG